MWIYYGMDIGEFNQFVVIMDLKKQQQTVQPNYCKHNMIFPEHHQNKFNFAFTWSIVNISILDL